MTKEKKVKEPKFEKELEEVVALIREKADNVKDQKHIAMKAYYVFLNESKAEKSWS